MDLTFLGKGKWPYRTSYGSKDGQKIEEKNGEVSLKRWLRLITKLSYK